MIGLGRHPLDLTVVGGMLHRLITADPGLIVIITGAGFGPGFGCRFHSITRLGRRPTPIPTPIPIPIPITGTNPIIHTNLGRRRHRLKDTGLCRRRRPLKGTGFHSRRLSTVGTVGNGFSPLAPFGGW